MRTHPIGVSLNQGWPITCASPLKCDLRYRHDRKDVIAVDLHTGSDVTVACYGPMVRTCLEAAEASTDISLEVVDMQSISPLDLETLASSVERTSRLVVVHEASMSGGVGAEIAARISEKCFYTLEAPVIRVTGFDVPYPASRLEEYFLPDLDRVIEAAEQVMRY